MPLSVMTNIERKRNAASPGSPADEVEIVQIVGRIAKITISVALAVKIIKHLPSWLEAVAKNPDFSVLGFLLKVFFYGFVTLLVLRTSYELWHDRRAQYQTSLMQFCQNCQLGFQKWGNLLLVKLKSCRFKRREIIMDSEPLSDAYPISRIFPFPLRKINFKQVHPRPWIFRSSNFLTFSINCMRKLIKVMKRSRTGEFLEPFHRETSKYCAQR